MVHGYAQGTSMKSYITMRRKVGEAGLNLVWIDLERRWRCVSYKILVFMVTSSLGEIRTTGWRGTSENVLIGLWQIRNGGVYFRLLGSSMATLDTLTTDRLSLQQREGAAHQGVGVGGFKFEACWLEEEDFRKVMEEAWEHVNVSQNVRVAGALKGVAAELSSWSHSVLWDLEKRIKKVRTELEGCRAGGLSREAVAREEVLRFKLDRLEEQVDIYWRQRAHVKWLKKGDRNTGFFHATCSKKKRRNRVGRLKNEAGGWEESEDGKKAVISNYFSNLFRSSNIDGAAQQLLDAAVPLVTVEMNE